MKLFVSVLLVLSTCVFASAQRSETEIPTDTISVKRALTEAGLNMQRYHLQKRMGTVNVMVGTVLMGTAAYLNNQEEAKRKKNPTTTKDNRDFYYIMGGFGGILFLTGNIQILSSTKFINRAGILLEQAGTQMKLTVKF